MCLSATWIIRTVTRVSETQQVVSDPWGHPREHGLETETGLSWATGSDSSSIMPPRLWPRILLILEKNIYSKQNRRFLSSKRMKGEEEPLNTHQHPLYHSCKARPSLYHCWHQDQVTFPGSNWGKACPNYLTLGMLVRLSLPWYSQCESGKHTPHRLCED